MARSAVTPHPFPLATGATYFPVTPLATGAADLTPTAADDTNHNYVPITSGKTVVLLHNTDASAHTVTIHSVADPQGRTGDITAYSIAAAKISSFGPFTIAPAGWNQSSPAGLWFDVDSNLVDIYVMTLP